MYKSWTGCHTQILNNWSAITLATCATYSFSVELSWCSRLLSPHNITLSSHSLSQIYTGLAWVSPFTHWKINIWNLWLICEQSSVPILLLRQDAINCGMNYSSSGRGCSLWFEGYTELPQYKVNVDCYTLCSLLWRGRKKIFFSNEGNGISTTPFYIQNSGKIQNKI